MTVRRKSTTKSRKRYKFTPYINRLARPLRGLVTPKYQSPDQLCRPCDRRPCRICCHHPTLCMPAIAKPLSKRLLRLAKPRKPRKKFKPRKYRLCRCACATVIRPGECSTRLEEMALPWVRNLVSAKKEFRPVVSEKTAGNFDQCIKKSFSTLYSRLANVKMPERRKTLSQWGPKEWEAYNEWAASNAKPKPTHSEPPTEPEPRRPIDFVHVDSMAKPRWPVPFYVDPGTKISDPVHPIKPSVLNFQMTPRLVQLTQPFKPVEPDDNDFEPYENPYDVPREYAKITGVGMTVLSEPRARWKSKRFQRGDNASVVFEVSKMARQAKPSEYTKKLAEPRKDLQTAPKPNPYGVAKTALSKKPVPKPKAEIYTKLATPRKRD